MNGNIKQGIFDISGSLGISHCSVMHSSQFPSKKEKGEQTILMESGHGWLNFDYGLMQMPLTELHKNYCPFCQLAEAHDSTSLEGAFFIKQDSVCKATPSV